MLSLSLALLLPAPALANERRFTYTYDTMVLPAGAVEIEPWTTVATKSDGTVAVTNRLEFEVGLSNRLLTALYLNTVADSAGYHFGGVSSEWKWNAISRVTAPVGLALYGEVTVAPTETKLEAKLLLDREQGPVLLAYNLVGEFEREGIGTTPAVALVLENKLAAATRLGEHGSLGLELVHESAFKEGAMEETEFLAGPALAWSSPSAWMAATVLPQLFAIAPGEGLHREEGLSLKVRVLLGFHL
jgi:hypothetical protein